MSDNSSKLDPSNPFAAKSTLAYQTPDFSKIKDEHFKPAFLAGMQEQLAEVDKIAHNSEAPNFENTIVAMEKTGQLLSRVNMTFNLLTSANTNPELQSLQEEMASKLAAHDDAIYLNPDLFKRVKAVYDQKATLKLDPESMRLIKYYYDNFVMKGANLPEDKKENLKELNKEEASLSAKFNNQLLNAAKAGAVKVTDKKDLAGLSDGDIAAIADSTGNSWTIPLQNTTQQPLLASLTERQMRNRLYEASWNRAERGDSNDTRKVISQLANIRAEQAKLLGFPNYAEWKLQDQMAKNATNVMDFLGKLAPAATGKAWKEAHALQGVIDKTGEHVELTAFDWDYYAEKLRKQKYDLDESQIKPYFELNKVLEDGVFYAANQLYGITFKERKDLPVYQKDVRVFEVFNEDGSQLGLFYCDYFKRDNKSGGAWMDNLVTQSTLMGTKPVIYNVCNFTKPAAGQPALLSYDDVSTMFHEFGHGLHGLFAAQKYPSLSGTNVARDFVEYPSQINENWALYPKVLKHYAVNYKTGEVIPDALISKIKSAGTFNQGYALTELMEAAALDMRWHTLSAGLPLQNVDSFEIQALKGSNLYLPIVPPRYRSSYFLHIWANGYSAGYYAYLWTEMLAHDSYQWFTEHGGLTRENGQRYRDMILSKGNTEDYAEMYRAFRGKDPDITPMKVARGLVD
jgi:peptidyl-dipeptidase Dcp